MVMLRELPQLSFNWDGNGNKSDQGWELGMDQGWDGNGENDMAHCSHLQIHLLKFPCAFIRRQPHQPRAVMTDGENKACLLTFTTNSHYYISHFHMS